MQSIFGRIGEPLARVPRTPPELLNDKGFRPLRRAAKGAAFGIRRLLKKAGENFACAALRATAPLQQPAQRARVPAGAAPLEKGGRKLYLCSRAVDENFVLRSAGEVVPLGEGRSAKNFFIFSRRRRAVFAIGTWGRF